MELGPRKLSGDFLGLAPVLLAEDGDRAPSIALKSKGEEDPLALNGSPRFPIGDAA